MKKLSGKVAIITGASKGIGASIAKELAAEGASVVVNYSSSKKDADRVVAEIVAQDGKAIAIQGDVAKSEDVQRLFAEAKKTFGTLDILVNNAGVYTFAPADQLTEAEFHRQFNTNVFGTLAAIQESLRYFDVNKGGSIINLGSVASVSPPPNASVYSATKGAVDALSISLSRELASRHIRVNVISPGPVDTEGTQTAGVIGSEFEKQMVANTPLGRVGQPRDIAKIALFLASSDSAWLTGERILASGGMR